MPKSKPPLEYDGLPVNVRPEALSFSAKAVAAAGHRIVFPEPGELAGLWVNDELKELEAQFLRTLDESGYTEDDLRGGTMLSRFIADADQTPRAPVNCAAEAMVGLDLVRALRAELASATPSPGRIARFALALGPLRGEVASHARTIRRVRLKGQRRFVAARSKKSAGKRTEVRQEAKRVTTLRIDSDSGPLSKNALASRIALKFGMKLSTVRRYLRDSSHPKARKA